MQTLNKKKTCVHILISDKIHFRAKQIAKDRERHYVIMSHKENVAILRIYASNKRGAKYVKRKQNGKENRQTDSCSQKPTTISQQLLEQLENQ